MTYSFKRIVVIVLDSVGIGYLPDAGDYGDIGANTLANVAEKHSFETLINLGDLGLGNIAPLMGMRPALAPRGAYGKMAELSKGKDTITGHWEIMGIRTENAFTTYLDGFPEQIIDMFVRNTGYQILGNIAASGTEIIKQLGEEHCRSVKPIVYTSADSVFQIAAHEEIIPLTELYRICKISRHILDEFFIARVIARPFIGQAGSFVRTNNRKDYAMEPTATSALEIMVNNGFKVIGVGKIENIFNGRGISSSIKTGPNEIGIRTTLELLEKDDQHQLIFVNLIDFDMLYGHRNDPEGYFASLLEFDKALPTIIDALNDDDLLFLTADHGCDPTYPGTDHTREYVPLIAFSKHPGFHPVQLGIRTSFADIGQTILDNFRCKERLPIGSSMMREFHG